MYSEIKCSGCNKSHYIQNKTLHLCSECIYKRNHQGKSQFEVMQEKSIQKEIKRRTELIERSLPSYGLENPGFKITKKKTTKPKVKKETGELKIFQEIWEEREHVCIHCGAKLYNFSVWYFEHIKPKSTHPELRLVKENIELLCSDCHFTKTNCGREIYERRRNTNKC